MDGADLHGDARPVREFYESGTARGAVCPSRAAHLVNDSAKGLHGNLQRMMWGGKRQIDASPIRLKAKSAWTPLPSSIVSPTS